MDYLQAYNEKELLRQLAGGSKEAFSKIFNHYRGKIYSVGLNYLKSAALAEEIVQDVFLKLWLKRSELLSVERLDAYLFIMSRNIIFDRIKKLAYQTEAEKKLSQDEPFIDDTEHLVREHECKQFVQEAIDMLPPQQKRVYQLAKVENLSHEQIAEQMQLSRLTVKAHMAKALQFIRKYLNARLNTFFVDLLFISICITLL